MPNRAAHHVLGTVAATGVAIATSRDIPDSACLIYCLGAAVGGYVGGIMPDVLEPAVHSHHRDVFHSVAATVALGAGSRALHSTAGTRLRSRAMELRAARLALPPRHESAWRLALEECLIWAALGILLGITVGYVTHVSADMLTPRGVPLVTRKLV